MEEDQLKFTEEIVEETFNNFSIDEDIEKRFNTLQTFVEQAKIEYQAYVKSREEYLKWLDRD
jgi:hypothetical protein